MALTLLAPALVSFVVCLAAMPTAARLARRMGLVAWPGGRHAHPMPTPLAGALVIASSVLASVAIMPGRPALLALAGALMVCALGIADDRRSLPALAKLAIQGLIAVAVVSAGLGGDILELPLIGEVSLGGARVPVLAGFLVFTMNAVNLLDGLDGLAGGVVVISALTMATLALGTGDVPVAACCLAFAAATAAFLRHNLRGEVFLGDQGSLACGFLLGGLALAGLTKTGTTVSLLPVLVLAMPLMDAGAVTVARMRRGLSPWRADRRHLHHRLLQRGLTPARVRRQLWGLTFACGAYAVLVDRVRALAPTHATAVWMGVGIVGALVLVALAGSILRAGRMRPEAT